MQQVREISSRISKEIVFFNLEWSKMEQEEAEHFLDAGETAPYRHYLQNLRRYADHLLSRIEETLLIEFSPVGRSSWTNLFEKIMGQLQFGDRKRGQEEVLSDLYSPDREVRRQAAGELTEVVNEV